MWRIHSWSLPLSSCLGYIPPLIELPFLRSLMRSVLLCGCLLFVCSVCFLVCVAVSYIFIYIFCRLCPFLATMPFADYCLVRFLLFAFLFPERVPGLIWFGLVYFVTTAGFVADQQIMWDKQQQTTLTINILRSTPI